MWQPLPMHLSVGAELASLLVLATSLACAKPSPPSETPDPTLTVREPSAPLKSDPPQPAPPKGTGPTVPAGGTDDVYWLSSLDEVFVVDVATLRYPALEAAAERDGPVPAGDPAIPAGWAPGDAWTAITETGSVPLVVESFAASRGLENVHLLVSMKATSNVPTSVLVVRGATRDATLAARMPVAVTLPDGPATLAALRKALAGKLESDAGKLDARRLRAEHVEAYEGHFGRGSSHLLVISAPMSDEAEDGSVNALCLLAGKRIEVIGNPSDLAPVTPAAVVDIDGDGLDEVALVEITYSGEFVHLLTWRDGKPVVRLMSGDESEGGGD
jgi:hypothetical protein